MQMKTVWLLVLLVLFSLSLSHQGHAEEEEPRPADWSGDAGLSVSTDGDSGTCAITPSHGHGTKNPACTPLTISGTETPSNGSVYTVTGGVGPFTWSASGGTITPSGERTATINVDGTCGNGTITVSGSCGSETKDVRFPVGQWVQIGFTRFGNDSFTFWNMKFYEGVETKVEILGSTRCWYDWCENTQDLESKGYVPVSEIDSPFLYPRHPEFGAFCEGNPSFNGGVSTDYCTGTRIFYASKETVYAWKCP